MTDSEMCMPVEQCQQLLVELQNLRLKITAMEQAVADVVKGAQQATPNPTSSRAGTSGDRAGAAAVGAS